MSRSNLIALLRVLISLGLLAWVFVGTGLSPVEILQGIQTPNWLLLAGAYGLSFAGIVLRAFRWKGLVEAAGGELTVRRAIYLYFVGAFFNTFLPTGFGGDVVRVLEAGPGLTSQQAAGTALVDRLTGFMALFAMALALTPFALPLLPEGMPVVIGGLSLAVATGSAALFNGRLARWALARLGQGKAGELRGWRRGYRDGLVWLGRTQEIIAALGPGALARAIAVSLVFNLVQVWASVWVARGLHIGVAAAYFVLFIPIATIALLVPSISGFGVREGFYVTLFGAVGLPPAQAVTLSLSAYSLDFVPGLVGGMLYLFGGVRKLGEGTQARAESPR